MDSRSLLSSVGRAFDCSVYDKSHRRVGGSTPAGEIVVPSLLRKNKYRGDLDFKIPPPMIDWTGARLRMMDLTAEDNNNNKNRFCE